MLSTYLFQLANPVLQGVGSTGEDYFNDLLPELISIGLVIGVIIFVLMMAYGFVQWITSRGDVGQLESAKSKVTQAVIGLVVLFSIFAITRVLSALLGINISTFQTPPIPGAPTSPPATSTPGAGTGTPGISPTGTPTPILSRHGTNCSTVCVQDFGSSCDYIQVAGVSDSYRDGDVSAGICRDLVGNCATIMYSHDPAIEDQTYPPNVCDWTECVCDGPAPDIPPGYYYFLTYCDPRGSGDCQAREELNPYPWQNISWINQGSQGHCIEDPENCLADTRTSYWRDGTLIDSYTIENRQYNYSCSSGGCSPWSNNPINMEDVSWYTADLGWIQGHCVNPPGGVCTAETRTVHWDAQGDLVDEITRGNDYWIYRCDFGPYGGETCGGINQSCTNSSDCCSNYCYNGSCQACEVTRHFTKDEIARWNGLNEFETRVVFWNHLHDLVEQITTPGGYIYQFRFEDGGGSAIPADWNGANLGDGTFPWYSSYEGACWDYISDVPIEVCALNSRTVYWSGGEDRFGNVSGLLYDNVFSHTP